MDKELIAMCDTPEIQGALREAKWKDWVCTSPDSRPVGGEGCSPRRIRGLEACDKCEYSMVFLPSVSWLLREIETNLKEWERLQLTSGWIAELHEGHSPYLSDLLFSSLAQDSPEKALTHVLLWQKGKVWKDGEWVRKEG